MASKRKTAKQADKPDTQLSIRLNGATLDELDDLIKLIGFGTRVQVLREAIAIGLPEIRKRYER